MFHNHSLHEAAGLPGNCTELKAMRYFRDDYLAKSDEWKRRIEGYYEIAPHLIERIKREESSDDIFSGVFCEIIKTVSLIKIGNLESATAQYNGMVHRLNKTLTRRKFGYKKVIKDV
jgi:hypothetical protein